MRRRVKARYASMNGGKLVVMMVLAGFLIGIAMFARSWQTAAADKRICEKVDRLTNGLVRYVQSQGGVPSKPGQPGYRYYHFIAPNEAKTLRNRDGVKAFAAYMRKAACDPNNLPSGGG